MTQGWGALVLSLLLLGSPLEAARCLIVLSDPVRNRTNPAAGNTRGHFVFEP